MRVEVWFVAEEWVPNEYLFLMPGIPRKGELVLVGTEYVVLEVGWYPEEGKVRVYLARSV